MKKLRLFILMLMAAMLPLAVQAQSTLTVNDGTTTSSYVPVYGLYVDDYLKCEYVIPAEDLADMTGGTISAMTFYLSSVASASWGSASFQVFMKEVDATTISAYTGTDDATIVYEGSLDGTQSEMNVEFTTPYTYNGGNLLVGFYNVVEGTYKSASFYGVTATGACVQGYSGSDLASVSATQRNFLPKTTFTYTPGAPAACPRPTDLTISNVTATSVDLAWTAGGSETAWTLLVNGNEISGVTATSYTLTGLNPGTTYTVKVQANCSDDEVSTWSNIVSFRTSYAIPFLEQFPNTTVPADWARYSGLLEGVMGGTATLTTTTSGWYFGTYNGVFDNHTRLNIYGSSCNYWLVAPSLMMEDNVRLTLNLALTTYSGTLTPVTAGDQGDDKFVILITTDNGTTWEILRQYDNAGSEYVYDNIATEGEFVAIDLSSYAGQNIAVAFYGESTASGGDNNLHIDNVRIDYIPSCEAPTALQVSDITANTAALTWTANNGETEWTIEVNGTEMTGITENPYTLTTTANTEYTVRVKANCSATDESEWSGTLTFTTPCEAVATIEEDFEAYTAGLPDCWTKLGAGTVEVQTSQPNSGSKSLKFSGVTGGNVVALPAIESYDGLYLTFSTKPESNSYANCGTFAVGYVTGDASTFQALETYNYNDTDFDGNVYAEMSVDVASVPANARLAFNHMAGATYYYWFVDDVNIEAAPTCLRPIDVVVSDITTTSATIAWTDNNETAPQSWTIDLNGEETEVTTNPYTFDNLTAATAYIVKVKANCTDDDESAWSSEVAFTTDCEVIVVTADNPYQEGFENEGICWTIEQVMGTYGWYTLESTNSYEGNAMAVCHYDPASESRLISPVLDITQLEEPTFTFQHHQAIYSNIVDDLHVYYRSSATEEWTLLASYTTEFADWTMETFSLPNPTATYQVAFLGHGNDGNYIWVDDINIFDNAAVPCATPTNVAVNDNVVTWTGNAANYNVQVTVAGEVVIDTTVATTTFTVEGLENGAHASVAVQAVCAEDDLSEWSEAVEFDYTNGINNYSLKANIYPNPTTGNVTVESDAINADITVFDAFGKLMMTSKVATERTELNFSEFAPGVYMVRIANDTAITTIKVVKK